MAGPHIVRKHLTLEWRVGGHIVHADIGKQTPCGALDRLHRFDVTEFSKSNLVLSGNIHGLPARCRTAHS
jgi:hypothetical protein